MRYRRKKKKRKGKTPKQIAWQWMSRAVRIKGVIETCERIKSLSVKDCIAECYTCGALVNITKGKHGGQAGHYRSRGSGGSSGIYFDERAVKVQCCICNAFRQGRPDEFREHLIRDYGEKVVDELDILHKLPARWQAKHYPALAIYWEQETLRLLEKTGINKWWK